MYLKKEVINDKFISIIRLINRKNNEINFCSENTYHTKVFFFSHIQFLNHHTHFFFSRISTVIVYITCSLDRSIYPRTHAQLNKELRPTLRVHTIRVDSLHSSQSTVAQRSAIQKQSQRIT